MSLEQLEDYIRALLAKQAELGAHYVRSQIEWAQAEIESLVAASADGQRSAAEADAAAGDFFTVCASSKFSSGGVVAPQIGLIRETPARKSHG